MPSITDELAHRTRAILDESVLREYEDLFEKQFVPMDDIGQLQGTGLWKQEIAAYVDIMAIKSMYLNDEWVYIVVDNQASKIASLPLRVMRHRVVDGERVSEPQENHPVQQRILHPNDSQTYYQWMYSLVADLLITGNSIAWDVKSASQIVHVPFEMVQMNFTRDGGLQNYGIVQYSMDSNIPAINLVRTIDPREAAHLRRPNPASAIYGLSPLVPARKSVLFARYSLEFLNAFYIRGANPSMILELDDKANEKNALRLIKSMENAYTGRHNMRRNMVLPKGVKAANYQQTLADQRLTDHVAQNRETILAVYGVPKHEVSLQASGSLGSEEHKTALKNYWAGPLKNLMSTVEESLTRLFLDELGTEFTLQFDTSEVEILKDDEKSKAELANLMLSTHTLNEVRSKLYKLPNLAGGDSAPIKPQAGFFSSPTPQVPGPVATSPAVKDQVIESDDQDPVATGAESILSAKRDIFYSLKDDHDGWWDDRETALSESYDKGVAQIHGIVLDLFADQAMSAIRAVRPALQEQGIAKEKAAGDKPKPFLKSRVRRAIDKALAKFEERWISDTQQVFEAQADVGYKAQLIVPFNLPDRAAIEALRVDNEDKRRDILEARGIKTFRHISETNTNKIMTIIEEGISSSRSIADIAKNIADDYRDVDRIGSRAMVIARTEVLTAVSIGQAAATEDAATVIPGLKKMWINAGDDRVRGKPGGLYEKSKADHWSIGGETRDWDEPFSNGLGFPRDPAGPPDQTIQCRCTQIMIPGDDAKRLGLTDLQNKYRDLLNTKAGDKKS